MAFRFSWNGGTDILGLPLDSASTAVLPADVALRAGGTAPLVSSFFAPAPAPGAPVLPVDMASYQDPPPGCTYYDLPQNRLPIALAPGAAAVLVATPVCPVGYVGIVRFLALVPAVAAAFVFSTRRNQAPVLPFSQASGAVGAMADPYRTFIEVRPNETIDVLGQNTGGVAQDVLVRLVCWFWPKF